MSVPYGVKLLYHSLNDYSMAFETAVPHLFSSNHCATLKYTDNCISARQPSLLPAMCFHTAPRLEMTTATLFLNFSSIVRYRHFSLK